MSNLQMYKKNPTRQTINKKLTKFPSPPPPDQNRTRQVSDTAVLILFLYCLHIVRILFLYCGYKNNIRTICKQYKNNIRYAVSGASQVGGGWAGGPFLPAGRRRSTHAALWSAGVSPAKIDRRRSTWPHYGAPASRRQKWTAGVSPATPRAGATPSPVSGYKKSPQGHKIGILMPLRGVGFLGGLIGGVAPA